MQSRTPRALAQADAPHNPLSFASRTANADRAKARARALKFLSYYRPHIPLLLADLACAVLVAATALFLPLCANYVARRLGAVGATPEVLNQIYAVGGVMLGLLAVQALATLFVDYQGHVMGAKMESALRTELFEHCQTLPFRFYEQQRVGRGIL